MLIVRAAKDWLLLIAQHWRATLPCFAGAALLYLGASAWWPKQYNATALVELSPSADWQSDIASQRSIEAEAIRLATTLPAWAAIVQRRNLFPETVADGRLSDAAEALASQASIEQIDDTKHAGPVVRVRYAAANRQQALDVTRAIVDSLVNPPSLASEPVAPLRLSPAPKTEPPLPATKQSLAGERQTVHQKPPSAWLAPQLQARIEEGAKLQAAISENAAAVAGLRQQLAQIDAKAGSRPPAAKNAPPPPEPKSVAQNISPPISPKINPQIEKLRQQLARDQQALDDLRKRYTEDYPDVVAAKDKAEDAQTDIRRLEAIEARSAQVESTPQPTQPPLAARDDSGRNPIAQRLGEAESLREKLRQALDRNREQLASLQSQMAASRSVEDTAPTSPSKYSDAPPKIQPVAPPAMQSISVADPGHSDPGLANPDAASAPPSPALPSGALSLAEGPKVAVRPACFAAPLSWLLGLAFGALAAFAAAWLAERRDPSIRSERMLLSLLPSSAAFLGAIPRVRHEAIPE
jgi:hypothetical protein